MKKPGTLKAIYDRKKSKTKNIHRSDLITGYTNICTNKNHGIIQKENQNAQIM